MNTLHVLFVVLILKAVVASPSSASKSEPEAPGPKDDRETTEAVSSTTTPTAPRATSPPTLKNVAEEVPNVVFQTKQSCQCYIDSPPKDNSTTCPGDDKKETDKYKENKKFCETVWKLLQNNAETTIAPPVIITETPATTEQPLLADMNTKICLKYMNKTESNSTTTEKDLKLICDIIAKFLEAENKTTAATTTTPTPVITEKPKEDIFSIAERICPCYDAKFNSTNCTIPADKIQSNVTSYNHTKELCEAISKVNKSSIPQYNAETNTTINPLNNTTAVNTTSAGTKEDDNPWSAFAAVFKDVCPCYGVPKDKDGNKTATCNKHPKGVKINVTKHDYKEMKELCERLETMLEKKKDQNRPSVKYINHTTAFTPAPNILPAATTQVNVGEPGKQQAVKSYSLGTVLGWSFGAVFFGMGAAVIVCLIYRCFKSPF